MANYLFRSYDSVSNISDENLANQKPPIITALQNENGELDLLANTYAVLVLKVFPLYDIYVQAVIPPCLPSQNILMMGHM